LTWRNAEVAATASPGGCYRDHHQATSTRSNPFVLANDTLGELFEDGGFSTGYGRNLLIEFFKPLCVVCFFLGDLFLNLGDFLFFR